MRNDIVIVSAVRSIVGATDGSIKHLDAARLSYHVIEGLLSGLENRSSTFSRNLVEHFIVGLCISSGTGQNLPRQIAHLCHMGSIESAFVVNEMCGSGLESIILGMHSLILDEYKMALVGGVEVPSISPYLISAGQLIEWKDKTVEEIQELVVKSDMYDALWCRIHNVHSIVHAEDTTGVYVKEKKLDPDKFKLEIDKYTIKSHDRALSAISNGWLKDEIIVISGTSKYDELPKKRELSLLQRRKGTQFTPNGRFLSNLNSPPLANNASYLMIMKQSEAEKLNLKPLARIIGYAKSGVQGEKFLLAPINAVKKLLKKTELEIEDFDLFEMNTAFGSQMLINRNELGLNIEKVNVYGDCIAYGHPVGAAGARLMTTLVHALKREKKRRGLVAICLGGGNAIAMAIERVEEQ